MSPKSLLAPQTGCSARPKSSTTGSRSTRPCFGKRCTQGNSRHEHWRQDDKIKTRRDVFSGKRSYYDRALEEATRVASDDNLPAAFLTNSYPFPAQSAVKELETPLRNAEW